MKLEQLQINGKPCANTTIIATNGNKTLYSYNRAICRADSHNNIILDPVYYDYSTTTARHRNSFLGVTTAQLKHMINNNLVKFANLND